MRNKIIYIWKQCEQDTSSKEKTVDDGDYLNHVTLKSLHEKYEIRDIDSVQVNDPKVYAIYN